MHRAVSPQLAPETARVEADSIAPLTLARSLQGTAGLTEGWLGAAWIAAVTLVERALRVPHLYLHARDVVMHAAAEIAAGACIWTLLWCLLAVLESVLHAVGSTPARRRRAAALVAILFGVGVGLLTCGIVVRKSSFWPRLPASVWWSAAVLGGVAAVFAGRRLLALALPQRPAPWGALLLALVVVPEVWGLERFVRHYGRSLGLVELVTLGIAGTGARLLFVRSGLLPRLRAASALLVLSSFAWLLTHSPSPSSRRALLVYGGVAKHVVLDVLWPLADRDGDGIPSTFWGTDPDDRNPKLTPLPPSLSGVAPPSPALATPTGPRRELLWIVVDTVRRDSFEHLLANDAKVGRAFASFGYFARYEACSARTDQVLYQLFGSSRCDARPLPGGRSLLAALHAAGYRDEAFRYFDIPLGLEHEELVADDRVLLARARRALDEPRGAPRLLLVHLHGGHEPYLAAGTTPRERYESQLATAFEGVAELVANAPPERYAVVVLGDHGEAFGEHLDTFHANTLYEEILETPLLVRGPRTKPGRHEEALSCPDVAWQALGALELWNEPVPDLGYRYAALDLLAGQYGHSQHDSMRALQISDYKLIFSPQAGIDELYQLSRDPHEESSLAESDRLRVAAFKAELRRISAACPVPRTGGEHSL